MGEVCDLHDRIANGPRVADVRGVFSVPSGVVIEPSERRAGGADAFMKRAIAMVLMLAALPGGALAAPSRLETRCGWIDNPTPANWWLVDRDGAWVLGVQGGYQAPGQERLPDFSRGEYVETNVHYGYACACLRVRVDRRTRRVLAIASGRQLPLNRCVSDRSLSQEGREGARRP